MRRIALLLLPLALLACAGNEKRGDRAAAVGDWKSAEREYAAALQGDPSNAEKRAKYQAARAQALQGAIAAARACQVSQDWECAFAESDYAARLEPGSAELAALRAEAARNAAFVRLRQASDAAARRDHRAAFDLLASAKGATPDAGVQAEAARVAPRVVAGAVQDAERHRAAQQYPQALELLSLAVTVDGGVRPRLDAVRAEQERWLEAQYEATAREGDALLADRRFAEAQARYEAAQRFRKGGRAEPLARYARALAHGEAAVQRRDWAASTAAYDEAVRTGMDGSGFAATELERVRIRPVAIRLRKVTVKPFRPDGAPWAGSRSRGLDRLVGRLASAALDRRGGVEALDVYDALPHENRPNLYATLVLPDGREYATAPQRAIRARLDSAVVVATNAYDDRVVWVRIAHAGEAGPVDVGTVSFRLMDVLAAELDLADRSIASLRVVAETSSLADGSARGFTPVAPPPPPAPATPPAPAPPRRR
jgi:hypothetical protein